MIEEQHYHHECGIAAQKHLKPDAVPTSYLFKPQQQSDESNMAAAVLLQVHKVVLVLKNENEDGYWFFFKSNMQTNR